MCASTTESQADWPATAVGSYVSGTCVAGYSGSPYRY